MHLHPFSMGTPSHTHPWMAIELAPSSPHKQHPNHLGGTTYSSSHHGSPYVQVSPTPGSYGNSSADTIFKALGRCGKRLEVTTRKATEMATSVWNHLKTSPDVTDVAISRIYQETKAYAEGGHDKIFKQTFGAFPGEQLLKSYACYLSTSSGPMVGTLYLSTVRLAFCSDKPVFYNSFQGYHGSTYYKIVVRLDQLRTVNSSANILNPAEKYIQIVTLDDQDFWFMGFVSYDKALKHVKEAFRLRTSR